MPCGDLLELVELDVRPKLSDLETAVVAKPEEEELILDQRTADEDIPSISFAGVVVGKTAIARRNCGVSVQLCNPECFWVLALSRVLGFQ